MNLQSRIENIKRSFNKEELTEKIQKIEKEMSDPNFWNDLERSSGLSRELTEYKKDLENYEMLVLMQEEGESRELIDLVDQLELKMYFSGKYDKSDVFFTIHSGTGGTEAMDWVEMLARMYTRYFEKKGWDYIETYKVPGEDAGIKTVSYSVKGPFVYGYLKFESGTHRLVRISPFNAQNLRQTSFAGVEIIPIIEDVSEIQIRDEDLEFSAMRSSGAGGQNVNKNETAVRIKHIPSGIAIHCQQERSQMKNKEVALRILKSKLLKIEEDKKKEEEAKIKGIYQAPAWGSQIRSYVLHPYQMVKDHRTEYEVSDANSVLDGNLDEFIQSEITNLSK